MRVFANANYDFIRWRWHALIASVLIIWAGVATIFLRGGMPMGIDFTGGTVLTLQFEQPTDDNAVRRALDPLSHDVVVQKIAPTPGQPDRHEIMVRLPLKSAEQQNEMLENGGKPIVDAVRAAHIGNFTPGGATIIGPSVGADLRTKGIWATIAALGGILVYVAFRFRPTFAIGAIIAAFHDILITLVFLNWFHYDMTLNIVAGILTITGYSVNDTIVVFDRVRENQRMPGMRREPLDQVVNKSVNQTLGRTIITSSATFLAVLALYVLGGEVLRGFAFTMMVGVITGTYSTVFIAASLAIILSRRSTSGPTAVAAAKPKRASA